MKKINHKRNSIAILAFFFVSYVFGQTPVTIKIGDPAPELKTVWIKGTPITQFEKDKIYVLEFWATWCGPCKAAMPHLSELAKEYADKVTIIGINIWENSGDEKKPYESNLPFVKEFVTSMGEKMAYDVAMDNNDQHMGNNWMRASGQMGIPATFLIKEGRITWVGHPRSLDKILEEVLSGTFDIESFAKKYNERTKKSQDAFAPYYELKTNVEKAIEANDYSEALNYIDNAIIAFKDKPQMRSFPYLLKLQTLCDYDVKQVIPFAKKWKKDIPQNLVHVGAAIALQDGLPKEVYEFGIATFTEALSQEGAMKSRIFDSIAMCYFKMGDLENAILFEEKAIEEEKHGANINKYKETLSKYKAAQK